jgi:hypothetical protein
VTKTQAADIGTTKATEWFNAAGWTTVAPDADRLQINADVSRLAARLAEDDLQISPQTARLSFRHAFETVAQRLWEGAYWQLPEVKAETRKRAAERWIERAVADFAEARDKFVANLSTNALYALEWSESLFEAAASAHVAEAMREILNRENGVDEAIKTATNMALQGARSPKQSTSGTSNLADRYRTAAFANFVEDMRYA